MTNEITIRTAREEDAAKLLEIYRPYVEKTAISFEYDVPSLKEFRSRIKNILKKQRNIKKKLRKYLQNIQKSKRTLASMKGQ